MTAVIGGLVLLQSGVAEARPRKAAVVPPPPPPVRLEHITSGAQVDLTTPAGDMASFLRCHYTGKQRPMDPRLFPLLLQTARHFQKQKIWIVSGYRAPEVAKQKGNPRSPHQHGLAIDFYMEGVNNQKVRDYLMKTFHHIGVGYYPRAGFVHVDVGRPRRHNAFWIDVSRPGERARYVDTGWLTKKRARPSKTRVG